MKNKLYLLILFLTTMSNLFAGSFINKTMVYGGSTRKYVIYVPTIYTTQNIKVPLLVGLHGNGDVASNFSQICMSSIADTANYIAVYPEALPDPLLTTNAWHSGAGALGVEVNSAVDDVGFINTVMDSIIKNYKIDTNRMYVFGFSFGGFMTNKMAASNAKRFSAAACVSGLRGNYNTSIPSVPVPYLHFHGTADPTITYTATGSPFPYLGLTAENTTQFWVTQNGCNTTPVIDTMPDLASDGLRFIRYTYSHTSNNNKVILYKVVNGDHDWYYRPSNDLDYCQTIWEFFRRYSKTPTTTPTPTASFTASDTTVCIGRTLTFTSTSTASTGSIDSIRWTILGGTPSTGTTTPIVSTFNSIGNYVITLKAYKSGNVSTVTKSIRVKALPNANAGADKVLTCSITSVQLNGSSTTNGAAFSWTGTGIVSNGNTATPTVNKAGNYTLTVTVAGCTSTDIALVSIDTIRPIANAGIDIILTCTNPTKLIGTVAVAGNTYTWSPTNGLSNTAIAQPTVSASGNYLLNANKTSNGCTSTDAVLVSMDTLKPNVQVSSSPICAGQTATLTASGADSYNWPTLGGNGNPKTTPILNTNTIYNVTGTKTSNGCTKTVSHTVVVNAIPTTPTITRRNDTVFCNVTGTQYKWYLNNVFLTTTSVAFLKVTQNGSYKVEVVNNSCTSLASAAINISLTGVKYNKLNLGFSIYPNPTNGLFEIKLTSITNRTYQLKLYNVSGQLISEEEMNVRIGENSKTMNLVGIEKGIYFLSIIGDDGVATQSILVQ